MTRLSSIDDTWDQGEEDFSVRGTSCSILVFHVGDMLFSRLVLDIYACFRRF